MNTRTQLLAQAREQQRRIDEEDRAGYLTEREAYNRRLRADITPEEAAEEIAERDRLIDTIGNLMINAMPVVS